MNKPLAELMRPKNIDDFVGQEHILNKNNAFYKMIIKNIIPNIIVYGECGTGKTSFCKILSHYTNKNFYKLNATNISFEELKDTIKNKDTIENTNGIVLYIDEIHYLNKRQQQYLLEYIETGEIVLIGSTTENPYYNIFNSLLSRCNIIEFKKIKKEDIKKIINKTILFLKEKEKSDIEIENKAIESIINLSNGDIRKTLNILEICYNSNIDKNKIIIKQKDIENLNIKNQINYDKDGNYHYDVLSAFQKSIRGSDIDASLYYLAILIKSNDMQSICRRLLVIACEDIGLSYPNAITIVKSCVDSANILGFPEAKIVLSQAVILLASLPKSNSCVTAINNAINEIEENGQKSVPQYLKNNNLSNYLYPHNYKNNYIYQEYLPKELIGKKFYEHSNNKFEQETKNYLESIKKNNKK